MFVFFLYLNGSVWCDLLSHPNTWDLLKIGFSENYIFRSCFGFIYKNDADCVLEGFALNFKDVYYS